MLMKNKREAQVQHLKKELAQLLESGQDQKARIRVEHVVREEKTAAAYNLLEIYCELIVARMPIIESQNCELKIKGWNLGIHILGMRPRQHWELELKDATAASQAAAESAERASMAARAAAELSSRGNVSQQYPMESHISSSHGMKDDELQKYTGSSSQNEHHDRQPVTNSRHGRNSEDYEQTNRHEQHNREAEVENVYSNAARK